MSSRAEEMFMEERRKADSKYAWKTWRSSNATLTDLEGFVRLWETTDDADVEIITSQGSVYAHSAILRSRSRLLEKSTKDTFGLMNRFIRLPLIHKNPKALKNMIKWIYTGNVCCLTEEALGDALDLWKMAREYYIPSLESHAAAELQRLVKIMPLPCTEEHANFLSLAVISIWSSSPSKDDYAELYDAFLLAVVRMSQGVLSTSNKRSDIIASRGAFFSMMRHAPRFDLDLQAYLAKQDADENDVNGNDADVDGVFENNTNEDGTAEDDANESDGTTEDVIDEDNTDEDSVSGVDDTVLVGEVEDLSDWSSY
ncbi:MAG: hypothetical protein M1820_009169 [Bogoriella megaspora]|nr:MAG: hypothetical protein M1820_009169 [Bogoriella megaspora]